MRAPEPTLPYHSGSRPVRVLSPGTGCSMSSVHLHAQNKPRADRAPPSAPCTPEALGGMLVRRAVEAPAGPGRTPRRARHPGAQAALREGAGGGRACRRAASGAPSGTPSSPKASQTRAMLTRARPGLNADTCAARPSARKPAQGALRAAQGGRSRAPCTPRLSSEAGSGRQQAAREASMRTVKAGRCAAVTAAGDVVLRAEARAGSMRCA